MEGANKYNNPGFKNRDLIFLSVDPWQNDRWARKQMLAFLLAEKFRNVIYYVDPHRSERIFPLVKRINKNIFLVDIPCIRLKDGKRFLGGVSKLMSFLCIWFVGWLVGIKRPIYMIYQPHNLEVAKKLSHHFGSSMFCYDMTDDWSEFPGQSPARKKIVRTSEEKVLKEVDLVFAASGKLLEKAKRINQKAFHLPNGTSFSNFNRVTENISIDPEVRACLKPRIGYIGKITPWRLDLDLIRFLAVNRPSWSFLLIGPIHPAARPFVKEVKEIKNLHLIGPKCYWDLPNYIKGFDACILPHKVDPLTESMDPIKLYDYLATGKTIVSTNIREAFKFKEIIKVVHSKEEFLSVLTDVIEKDDGIDFTKRVETARENSWENRIGDLMKIFEQSEKELGKEKGEGRNNR